MRSELDRARRLAAEMLMERLADDVLELEEFERRLDQVNAASSVEAIADILGQMAASRARTRLPQVGSLGGESPARREPPLEATRGVPGRGRRSSVVLAFQEGAGRVGTWSPARHVWVVNMLGGAVMDFRDADLPSGVTELTVFCIMGDVEVIVPLDLQVEFGGLGLIGGFDCQATVGVSSPDAPVLRINGVSCLGGVTVAVRAQGEPRPSSRRRRPIGGGPRLGARDPAGGPRAQGPAGTPPKPGSPRAERRGVLPEPSRRLEHP